MPWPRVLKAAREYADWQAFALKVRAACEPAEDIPSSTAQELNSRCPGFIDWTLDRRRRNPARYSVWRDLVQWVAKGRFEDAQAEGWYHAVVHYGFNRIECLHAWSDWATASGENLPGIPTLADSPKLSSAVDALLDSRARLLWVTTLTDQDRSVSRSVLAEAGAWFRQPLLDELGVWNRNAFVRLARNLDRQCTTEARAEGWYGTLCHQLVHHPRYHRLIHFSTHCRSEWRSVTPRPMPTLDRWTRACDEYCLPRPPYP